MKEFKNTFEPIKQKIEKPKKLEKEDVIKKLANGENLENLTLSGLNLAGLNFEGKSFHGSDIRGMSLYREEPGENGENVEIKTNVKGADFTDAIITDLDGTDFFKASAEGAKFGYAEDLASRRKRHQEMEEKTGKGPNEKDTGGIFGFDGRDGDFMKTKWTNVDFGGGSGFEAVFDGADFSGATFTGCDLSGIDFSEVNINNIKIINSVSTEGMKINESQIEIISQSIQLANPEKQAEFLKEKEEKGARKALEDCCQIIIV